MCLFVKCAGIYIYSEHFPPGGGGFFLSKFKNREEFEGGLHKKRKGKGDEGKNRGRVLKGDFFFVSYEYFIFTME